MLKVGKKVKFVNEDLEGVIITIISDKEVVVDCSDGFEHSVAVSELIVINDDDSAHYTIDENKLSDKVKKVTIHQPIPNQFLSRYMTNTKYQFERLIEVDLHLEELVEFPNKLDDWQKLHTQLQHVKKCLSAAMENRVKRIVFIHGKGTGVLKAELLSLLSDYDNVSFKEADFREYGGGATEVYIK